jgi:hypothetical protein
MKKAPPSLPRYATDIMPQGLTEEETIQRALQNSAPHPLPHPPPSFSPWAAPPPPPPPVAPAYVPLVLPSGHGIYRNSSCSSFQEIELKRFQELTVVKCKKAYPHSLNFFLKNIIFRLEKKRVRLVISCIFVVNPYVATIQTSGRVIGQKVFSYTCAIYMVFRAFLTDDI